MTLLVDLDPEAARSHLLKGSSYFREDLPNYLSFEGLLQGTSALLNGETFHSFQESSPSKHSGVNYRFLTNKDGRFAWRPYELIHPAIYVSLVNTICAANNWTMIQARFRDFGACSAVECCSAPLVTDHNSSDAATRVRSWWQLNEQRSLAFSMDFSHLLHTDVSDCYGSLYTHSIAWALHGMETAKQRSQDPDLLGNVLDRLVRAGRHGQTNGIAQGSVLMDLLAELVLGYVDEQITEALSPSDEGSFKILRYRDDYRIFANSDDQCEKIVQIISAQLLSVGMKLGVSKTVTHRNIVEGAIKPDKLAGIGLEGMDLENAKTMQKELLRLHSFGQRFPNSGALRRLVGGFHEKMSTLRQPPDNLEVCVAIATDIGYVSPTTFPAVAGILSYLLVDAPLGGRTALWERVCNKMRRVPHNGYLDVWLQRVTRPKSIGLEFHSTEAICMLAESAPAQLWNSSWIKDESLLSAVDETGVVIGDLEDSRDVIEPREVALFVMNALAY